MFARLWKWLFGLGLDELARRLGVSVEELKAIRPNYQRFEIPKRSGGSRTILAPDPDLKRLQRRILRRLLDRLRVHPAATGFERGCSIAHNARRHVGQAVVVKLDIQDFFPSTTTKRINRFFRRLGWGRRARQRLVRLCTFEGGLPQGAPTSPRLSNLVNHRLDARLDGLARSFGAVYTRYADDLTFSFAEEPRPNTVSFLIVRVDRILREHGYRPHRRKKCHVRRRHQSQRVTGLVVNERVALPREVRRRLRAIEHHHRTNRPATLSPEQLAGWRAFETMIVRQGEGEGETDRTVGG